MPFHFNIQTKKEGGFDGQFLSRFLASKIDPPHRRQSIGIPDDSSKKPPPSRGDSNYVFYHETPNLQDSWGGNGGRFMTSTHICEKYVLSSRSGSVGTRKSYYSTMFSLVMFAQTLVSSSGTVNYNAANQSSRNYSFKPYIFYFLISFWFISLQGVTSRDYWFKPY
ncbi:unnamed protein product [Musa hybrid cultivar]